MNHQDFIAEWIDEGNGTWSFGTCGVQMRVENTRWDVCLPVGQHVTGTAATTDQAKQLAFDQFVAFAIQQLVSHRVTLPPGPAA